MSKAPSVHTVHTMTPDAAAAARLAVLNDSRVALTAACSPEALGLIDKGIRGEFRAASATRSAAWALVTACRDLGVPTRDSGVTKMIQTMLREHAVSKYPKHDKSAEGHDPDHTAAVIKWADWSKVIQRAVYFGVPEGKFGISLKNDPEFRIDGKGAQAGAGAAGAVSTTTLHATFTTFSKFLRQLRMLNQLDAAAEHLDLMLGRFPEFKELDDDGKPVTK